MSGTCQRSGFLSSALSGASGFFFFDHLLVCLDNIAKFGRQPTKSHGPPSTHEVAVSAHSLADDPDLNEKKAPTYAR